MKIGGRLVKHARYYWLLLAEGHLNRRLFGDMLGRIWAPTCARRLKCLVRSGPEMGSLPKGNVGAVWSHGRRASPNATIAPCWTPRARMKGGLNATG